ncbi:uncharacterized protein [Choristoneura fumiferana]|uniref:uncharacterized protein n=1 Tax=Choristoneura fumiferana TaxID=7141 RepID=UPI003D158377
MVLTVEQLVNVLQDTATLLQKTQNNLRKCPKVRLTKGYVESRLKCIENYWTTFLNAHQDLLKCVPKEQRMDIPYLVNEEYYIYEDLYLCMTGDLKDMLMGGHCTQPTTVEDQVKLPRIQPPVFSGNYEDWPTFQDLFESLIHNNKTLTDVMKLHFLKNSVSGEAYSLLKNIQVTNKNYEEAWKTLKNRYGNKRMIVNAVLKRLFSQKRNYAQCASQIKSLLDTTTECLNSLTNLAVPVDSWDPIIVHLIVMKLDADTHKDWEEYSFKSSTDNLPKWSELKGFLETKFRTLEFINSTTPAATSSARQPTQKSNYINSNSAAASRVQKSFHTTEQPPPNKTCIKCNESHTLSHCKSFASMDVTERVDYVKNNNLCYNCLLSGHTVFKCRLPTSCQVCHKRHHSLLHHTKNENPKTHLSQLEESDDEEEQHEIDNIAIATHFTTKKSTVLLATALVPVRDEMGQVITLRALIDQGSQASFITERAVQLMQLKKKPTRGSVTGVGSTRTTINSVVQCELLSRCETDFSLQIEAYVLATRLTTELPSRTITTRPNAWQHLTGLDLADPSYYQPGRVDMLLGVDIYAHILKNNIIKGPPGSPCAQNTSLGWILFGDIIDNSSENNIVVMHHNLDLDLLVKNMWELESAEKPELTAEEKLCENIYANTTTRTKEGRYIVKLPTKTDNLKSTKGETKDIALRRFKQLERKFEKDKEFKTEYTKVIEEYSTLGHMEEVPESEKGNPSVYLPHHAVIRNDKDTTKVRAVFDASSKGINNVSLNNELLVGPQLQDDMRNIIMRWRMKKICFVADIQKMYRQILVTKQDSDLQRLLWRNNTKDPIQEYRLLRVTFGTASAPYLAVKTLQRVSDDEGRHHPEATKTIKEDFYMDDLMSGQDSLEEAVDVAKTIADILKKGGFDLQKWSSNSTDFLKQFSSDERNSNVNMAIELDGTVRALGISWNMGEDDFQYRIQLPQAPESITKRIILAETLKLFDPLGWLAPSIIQAKMLIQKLWLHRSSWDEEVDPEIKEKWLDIRNNLTHLNNISIPRWVHTNKLRLNKTTVHGFCDASTNAYAAVAYLRVETEEREIKTSIIAAKARVAPVKPLSLPRLELCGAALLAKLLKQIRNAMRIPERQVFAWTDSTIVLSWLKGDPNRWQTFVRNRVVAILDDTGDKWYHVRSQSNPADVASRGTPLSELISHELWWSGPEWLRTQEIPFHKPDVTTELEMKRTIQSNLKVTQEDDNFSITNHFEDFDDLTQLLKSISHCKRFLKYKNITTRTILTTEELDISLKICIRLIQGQIFNEEIHRLQTNKQVRHDSKLKSLNPYLDDEKILRVGGRLKHTTLSEDSKNPIILDNKNRLTFLLVADAHQKTLHGGQQLMMCYLRTKYWILNMKRSVRLYIRKCLICARQNATVKKQLMGDLPKQRVTPARPFLNSGVDFAGPYQTLMSRGRGIRTTKSYIAIFICMVTKAIHLELVGDLTSEAFIGAFRRFVSRRGRCANLWSDQGRNFIGASKALAEAFNEAKLDFDVEIADKLSQDGTQWHYVPVYSPNFGGLWESGVKSMKFHLKRVLNSYLTFEEMTTLLCQVEACLNSRPYNPIDEDENIDSLTPGHFLIGEAPITIPSPTFSTAKISNLSRWQHLQKLLNDFWHKWQQEYLCRLQQRRKWTKQESEFDIGQIVLIKNENLPPGKWLMGRIMEKHPGSDGLTRVYSVKSGEQVVKRSVSKLCYFPIDDKAE